MQVGKLDIETLAASPIRGLKRAEYEALVEIGAFTDERVELLCGQIVTMSPEGFEHRDATHWLLRRLIRAFADDELEIFHDASFAANADSMLQPDIYVGNTSRGKREHANPTTVLWLIEVSNTSLRRDRGLKARIYADCGVQEYWIVDVSGSSPVVEGYTDPVDGTYATVRQYRDGDVIRPKRVPIDIAVADIPR